MPRSKVVWLPEALVDVARLRDFLRPLDPAAARRAAERIKSAARKLARFPEIGRPVEGLVGFRELIAPFGAGAYVIRYRVDGETVVIVQVWHSREDR